MERKALLDIFIKLLGSALNEAELDGAVKNELTPDVIAALFSLSKRHDLAHIVSAVLYKNGLLTNEETISKYKHEEVVSIYRYEQMKYAYGQICDAFEEAAIPYIPLKGSVIRPYYPKASMRTSCDIDILVKEEDLERAIQALVQRHFQCGQRNYHDVSLYSPNKIHLELHFNILENTQTLDTVLKDAWLHAAPVKGCCYGFTDGFFLFHMFAHISYHFLSGGCGIRPLMDIWIMGHRMGIHYSQAEELLKRAGIFQFAEEITELVEACFSDADRDAFSDTLLAYIFDGGVYGTTQNKIAISKAKENTTFSYAWKRVFLPYHKMVNHFAILRKLPILLPFCWIARVVKAVFAGKTQNTMQEIDTANSLSEAAVSDMKQIRNRLGL